jgi:hypothetical protein
LFANCFEFASAFTKLLERPTQVSFKYQPLYIQVFNLFGFLGRNWSCLPMTPAFSKLLERPTQVSFKNKLLQDQVFGVVWLLGGLFANLLCQPSASCWSGLHR